MGARTGEILILACGNSLRGDDGAGLVLARSLFSFLTTVGRDAHLICAQQFAPELAQDIAGEHVACVLFVDTRVVAQAAEAEARITLEPLDATCTAPAISHHTTPHTLLVYARQLYHRAPPAWLATIPGFTFDHGTEFSPVVRKLLGDTEELRQALLRSILLT